MIQAMKYNKKENTQSSLDFPSVNETISSKNNYISEYNPKRTINMPRATKCKMNSMNFPGDTIPKSVDFYEKKTLCQFIKESPPNAFKRETTELALLLSDLE